MIVRWGARSGAGLLVAVLAFAACVTVSTTERDIVLIDGPGSDAERAAFAKSFVTRERYNGLRAEIRSHFPQVSDEQLQGLFVNWFHPMAGQPGDVGIAVGVTYSGAFDAKPLVLFAKQWVADEIKRVRQATSPKDRSSQGSAAAEQ